MARDNKVRMPSSGGGLIRYYDEYKSRLQIEPLYVIIAIVVIAILVIVLHKMNPLG